MSIRPIRLFGDPVLRTEADPVGEVDAAVTNLVADMFETMDDAEGLGLAGPQVGVSRRVFVYDDREGTRGALLDPVWTAIDDERETDFEGCLSVPDVGGEVERFTRVRVTGRNEHGKPVTFEWSGLLARICQHEIDHLDGVMFMQRMAADSRREAMRAIRAAEWFGCAAAVGDFVYPDLAEAETAAAAQS